MILCYLVFVIMSCFWATFASILLLVDVKELHGPQWRQGMYRGVTYGSVLFYAIAIFAAYKFYKMLKRQWIETMGGGGVEVGEIGGRSGYSNNNPYVVESFAGDNQESSPGDVIGGSFPAPGNVSAPTYSPTTTTTATTTAVVGGSVIFKGKGYRLSDGKRLGGN
mmetsp:Transcript_43049/g.69357  ORF Transcript_43049/g.69357 Transcript_43049/m.69357 type:complete len:165 (-) Transcript_43049:168-662(-)